MKAKFEDPEIEVISFEVMDKIGADVEPIPGDNDLSIPGGDVWD